MAGWHCHIGRLQVGAPTKSSGYDCRKKFILPWLSRSPSPWDSAQGVAPGRHVRHARSGPCWCHPHPQSPTSPQMSMEEMRLRSEQALDFAGIFKACTPAEPPPMTLIRISPMKVMYGLCLCTCIPWPIHLMRDVQKLTDVLSNELDTRAGHCSRQSWGSSCWVSSQPHFKKSQESRYTSMRMHRIVGTGPCLKLFACKSGTANHPWHHAMVSISAQGCACRLTHGHALVDLDRVQEIRIKMMSRELK